MKRLLVVGSAAALAVTASLVGATAYAEDSGSSDTDAVSAGITAAESHVKSASAELFAGDDDEFTRDDTVNTLGLTFSTFDRSYQGLPVAGGDVVVATDKSGEVAYSNTAQTEAIDLASIEPRVSAADAQDAVGAKASDAELVVYAWDTPTLAYMSSTAGTDSDGAPVKQDHYIDAITGEEIAAVDTVFSGTGNTFYNGQGETVEFGTSEGGDGFVMEDPDLPGLACAEEGGDPFTKAEDTWGDGTGTDLETACVDGMYGAAQQADMLAEWLDRDGIDGEGGYFPLYVGMPDANAYWDGSSATFGISSDEERNLTPTDIVAHELGHGIFQFTPGGSSGDNETGGLNEGAGDIFGALTEWYADQPNEDGYDPPDYLVGEEGGLATAGEPIRSMPDPEAYDAPACWSEDIPGGEVHDNAGPINHWFYMLAEGTEAGGDGVPGSEACDGSSLEGIGIETAGQVWMGAMMGKTSGWTYADARASALEFAGSSELFESCAEYDATKAAFDAVSVPGESDPECQK